MPESGENLSKTNLARNRKKQKQKQTTNLAEGNDITVPSPQFNR